MARTKNSTEAVATQVKPVVNNTAAAAAAAAQARVWAEPQVERAGQVMQESSPRPPAAACSRPAPGRHPRSSAPAR